MFVKKSSEKFLVLLAALIGFSSSAAADSNANSDAVLVFGTFELQENGYTVKMRDGLFGNTAALYLRNADTLEEHVIKVGDEGVFSAKLTPGDYLITNIEFRLQSQVVKPETNVVVSVTNSHDANYIGTLTMRTRIDSGYYGASGSIEKFSVRDNCNEECPDLMERLGAEGATMAVSLPSAGQQLAFSQ